ncbi:hypothetical protein F8388_002521 [Cannabis sativa]|uniref:Uncharacterized protein n=1 Tax=Cannabis sativa TaxID=3483 RepID=A0A7J6I050_CANSA|nr:hypothetical protein F8388_002521 [Cannabis sativa]KAF4400010.1 hypothetical protein G4B88_021224 [Cannabis sativa]
MVVGFEGLSKRVVGFEGRAPIILMEVNKAPANYVSFEPNKEVNSGGQGGFGRRPEVESCLPKGFRQTSAPSRYVNYDTLGSTLCSSPTSDRKP